MARRLQMVGPAEPTNAGRDECEYASAPKTLPRMPEAGCEFFATGWRDEEASFQGRDAVLGAKPTLVAIDRETATLLFPNAPG